MNYEFTKIKGLTDEENRDFIGLVFAARGNSEMQGKVLDLFYSNITVRHMYEIIYTREKRTYLDNLDISEDKASRMANIYAVKNTWREFNGCDGL